MCCPFDASRSLSVQIIFDDAVVDDDDLAGLIAVRMSVFLGRSPVRRPTRVTDAVVSVERMQTNAFLEIPQLPFGAAQFEMVIHRQRPRCRPNRTRDIPASVSRR